jgi:hypothetical protein
MLSNILKPRLVQIGCIKIGCKGEERAGKNGSTWRMPQKLDHFLLTTMNRGPKGDLMLDQALMGQLAGDGFADADGKIRRLPVQVLSNDPGDVMQASYCWYGTRSIGARSDGSTLTWLRGHGPQDWGKLLPEPIEEPWLPEMVEKRDGAGNLMFKLHCNFNCVLASKGSRFGGVHRFRTTSRISADQLYGGLMHIAQLTNGILMGLPLQLVVRPMQVNPVINGQSRPSTVYVVHLEIVGDDLQKIQEAALRQAKWQLEARTDTNRALIEYKALLRDPGFESPEEQADIAAEFHPQGIQTPPSGSAPINMPKSMAETAAAAEPEPVQDPGDGDFGGPSDETEEPASAGASSGPTPVPGAPPTYERQPGDEDDEMRDNPPPQSGEIAVAEQNFLNAIANVKTFADVDSLYALADAKKELIGQAKWLEWRNLVRLKKESLPKAAGKPARASSK